MSPVTRPKRFLGFQLAQLFEYFRVGERVAAFDGHLVGVGARFPLLARLAGPVFELFQ